MMSLSRMKQSRLFDVLQAGEDNHDNGSKYGGKW